MTGDLRSDSELLADLPRQPELMGMLYERHARGVFRYLARFISPDSRSPRPPPGSPISTLAII